MPSSDQPQHVYTSYLDMVDNTISQVNPSSPLIVIGNLNCHMGGPKSSDNPNTRGVQWKELIDRHSLYVPSLSHLAAGPVHTYQNNETATTLDYVIGNLSASAVLNSCSIIEDHPLNTSDHLPVVSKLNLRLLPSPVSPKRNPSLDWDQANKDGSILFYASLSNDLVKPLLKNIYSTIQEIEVDISHVSKSLLSAATSSIPHFSSLSSHSCRRIIDAYLSTLCGRSRDAFRQWKEAGRPRSGPVFKKRKKCKKDISLHLSKCRERISIQKRDESFQSRHPKRFQSHSQKTGGTSLKVSGILITDPVDILREWSDHFTTLGKSHCSSNPALQEVLSRLPKIEAQTYDDVELILDSPFLLEVEAAIKHLKRGSSGGPDSLSPHHLLYAGTLFKEWLCEIFNKIVDFETIPVSFKEGIIIPIYKGKGKDPLSSKSYRGITLTSESFEFLLLDRLLPILNDNNLPQLTQKEASHVLMLSSPVKRSFPN